MSKSCLECGDKIIGREDKKFLFGWLPQCVQQQNEQRSEQSDAQHKQQIA